MANYRFPIVMVVIVVVLSAIVFLAEKSTPTTPKVVRVQLVEEKEEGELPSQCFGQLTEYDPFAGGRAPKINFSAACKLEGEDLYIGFVLTGNPCTGFVLQQKCTSGIQFSSEGQRQEDGTILFDAEIVEGPAYREPTGGSVSPVGIGWKTILVVTISPAS